jgi:hypothetical protein
LNGAVCSGLTAVREIKGAGWMNKQIVIPWAEEMFSSHVAQIKSIQGKGNKSHNYGNISKY